MASDVRDIQITPEAVKKYKKSSLSDALLQPLFNGVIRSRFERCGSAGGRNRPDITRK